MRMMRAKPDITTDTHHFVLRADRAVEWLAVQLRFPYTTSDVRFVKLAAGVRCRAAARIIAGFDLTNNGAGRPSSGITERQARRPAATR